MTGEEKNKRDETSVLEEWVRKEEGGDKGKLTLPSAFQVANFTQSKTLGDYEELPPPCSGLRDFPDLLLSEAGAFLLCLGPSPASEGHNHRPHLCAWILLNS